MGPRRYSLTNQPLNDRRRRPKQVQHPAQWPKAQPPMAGPLSGRPEGDPARPPMAQVSMSRSSSHAQRGQSLTEFVISMFGFGLLLLSLLQAILLYRAKTTVDYAAMEAARAGALHGVDKD